MLSQFRKRRERRRNAAKFYVIAARAISKLNTAKWTEREAAHLEAVLRKLDIDIAATEFAQFATWINESGAWKKAFRQLYDRYYLGDAPRSAGFNEEAALGALSDYVDFGKIAPKDLERVKTALVSGYERAQRRRAKDFFNVSLDFKLKNNDVLAAIDSHVLFWADHYNTLYAEAARVVGDELYEGLHPYQISRPQKVLDVSIIPGEGESISEIEKKIVWRLEPSRLGEMMLGRAQYRIDAFARTESQSMMAMVNSDHYDKNPQVYGGAQWLAFKGEGHRHYHMNEQKRNLDGKYSFRTGEGDTILVKRPMDFNMPVGDRVNCMCVEEGIVLDFDPATDFLWGGA